MHLASNKNLTIRTVATDDAKGVQAIYAPYVENTTISFETTLLTPSEMALRIAVTSGKYPWIVFERDKKILRYANASQHRTREAYRWSVEVAVMATSKQAELCPLTVCPWLPAGCHFQPLREPHIFFGASSWTLAQ